jgi:hypothetical protein
MYVDFKGIYVQSKYSSSAEESKFFLIFWIFEKKQFLFYTLSHTVQND